MNYISYSHAYNLIHDTGPFRVGKKVVCDRNSSFGFGSADTLGFGFGFGFFGFGFGFGFGQ